MYAYIDSFRKFGKTNTDNQSIKIKRPYPERGGGFIIRQRSDYPINSVYCSAVSSVSYSAGSLTRTFTSQPSP